MEQKIRVIRKKKKSKSYFMIYLYMLFVLMSLLVVSTYTWFTMSRIPRVSDMRVYITSTSGLELSADPFASDEEWQVQMNFWSTVKNPQTQLPVIFTQLSLRPATWSEEEQTFRAAAYGADGRLLEHDYWHKLTDLSNSNIPGVHQYYIKSVYYARCGMLADITLAPAMVVDDRGTMGAGTYVIGTPSWSVEDLINLNSGKGAESSIRIGMRTTPMMITKEGSLVETGDRGPMVIYEPNADRHVDGSSGYIPTPSIDGTETLVEESRLLTQKATGWTNLDPAEIENIKLSPGEFMKDPLPKLFTVGPGQIIRIEMYIWLEGQDVDCINAMNGAQLMANIQFTGHSFGNSGMTSIHDLPPVEE